jgi:hypothetical protein
MEEKRDREEERRKYVDNKGSWLVKRKANGGKA